jgi:hypothetical protein
MGQEGLTWHFTLRQAELSHDNSVMTQKLQGILKHVSLQQTLGDARRRSAPKNTACMQSVTVLPEFSHTQSTISLIPVAAQSMA